MSSPRHLPPIRRPEGTTATLGRSKKAGRRRRWPAWAMAAVSVLGIVIAVVAWNAQVSQTRMIIAIGGFGLVIVVGTVMLFVQRVLDVGAARLSGTPLISSFDSFDKLAFVLLLVGSVSNGIVIALEVARH